MTEVAETVDVKDIEQKKDAPVDVKAEDTQDSKNDGYKKARRGILSDASILPESSDHDEIRKQVEFYFTDSNLRFDKYLFSMVTMDNNWVGIDMISRFNRMLRFPFAEVLKAMETSEVLELSEDKTQIRRKVPLAPVKEYVDKTIERSLYAKGFGKETESSQFDIEAFFEQSKLKVNAVRLRRDDNKVFKGSVFVEFKDPDTLDKFMGLKEMPKWNGEEAKEFMRPNYEEVKKEPKAEVKAEETEAKAEESEVKTEDTKKEEAEVSKPKFIPDDEIPTEEKAIKEAKEGVRFMRKKDFVDMKMDDIRAGRIKPQTHREQKFDAFKSPNQNSRGRGRGGFRGRGGDNHGHRGDRDNYKSRNRDGDRRDNNRDRDDKRDDRDWKTRRDEDRKNGFKDDRDDKRGNGDRRGRDHRDNRDNRDRNSRGSGRGRSDRNRDRSPGPRDRDGKGIPKIRTGDPLPPRLSAFLNDKKESNGESMDATPTKTVESKAAGVPKRARDEDAPSSPTKKVKTDGEA